MPVTNAPTVLGTLGLLVAGFSAISAVALFVAFVALVELPNKSRYSVASCAVLLASLATIQIFQAVWFQGGPAPLDFLPYRVAIFCVPVTFFLFSRWVLLPAEPFRPILLLHVVPIPVLLLIRREIALPLLFVIGTAYSAWLINLVYGLRDPRRRYRFEVFFFGMMCVLAVLVLIVGFSLPYVGDAFFYHFYAHAIGLAFVIVTVALIGRPDLLGEMAEAARVKYGASTLRGVDVDDCLRRLEALMTVSKAYQDEGLSLGSLARQLRLSNHQLSELINTRLGMGFSRYVRERRVAAAKALLLSAPAQSILSISMETGFRSQSSFYSAFKEVTGQSPGDYRRTRGRSAGG